MIANLALLPPVELVQLNAEAELLHRVDRKYLLSEAEVLHLLESLPANTRVLDIDGEREFAYRSTYFDTPDLASFLAAAHRRPRRGKVRQRTYESSGDSFLEVKVRRSSWTTKERIPWQPELNRRFVDDSLAHGGVQLIGELTPQLVVGYRRSTLLLPDASARITIDSQLQFDLADGSPHVQLQDTWIVETKTDQHPCVADKLLWQSGCRPVHVSKYATGLALLRPELPNNRWHRLISNIQTARN